MTIASSDEKIPFFALRCSHRRHIRVYQRPKHLRKDGFGRTLFARHRQDQVGPATAQCRQEPSYDENEIVTGRDRERQHAGSPPKPHRWTRDDFPAVWSNLDRAPALVGKIKIDESILLGDAQENRSLRSVKLVSSLR
jgi:hypothetical protein